MGAKLDIKIAQLRKHPQYARFNGQTLRLIAIDKLKREPDEPCYCQRWTKCNKCRRYKQRFDANKAAGLWEGPGYRPLKKSNPI